MNTWEQSSLSNGESYELLLSIKLKLIEWDRYGEHYRDQQLFIGGKQHQHICWAQSRQVELSIII